MEQFRSVHLPDFMERAPIGGFSVRHVSGSDLKTVWCGRGGRKSDMPGHIVAVANQAGPWSAAQNMGWLSKS